ncbi:MAG: response regulator, partial [Acidobacteriota bacterium]|nr:response regulator [Acidobacteriota bacterium]
MDANFPRAPFAVRSSLVSGLAFPIRVRGAVTMVVEFFSRQRRPQDPSVLQMLAEFGNKVGQFAERKRDVAALERAEARLRHLVTASPTITYSCRVDNGFTVTFVSDNVERLFGWSPRQFIDDPDFFLSKVHEDDRPVLLAAYDRLVQTGFAEYDYRFLHRDGTYVWRHDALRGVPDQSGRIAEAVGASQDVTALKRIEEELRASEIQKSAMLDTALDCVVTMDHEGRVVEFNEVAERTFGYSRGQVIGREMAETIIPPPMRDAHRRGLARVVAGQGSAILGRRLELTALRSDGTELPVELAITRVERAGPPLFVGYLRDITARKAAEEELRRAKVAAEAANESKSAFLASMSHEIRTPLNAIVGMTELALGTSLTTEQREYIETVQAGSDALLRLINDVLDFSKIEAGQLDIDDTPFDLRELIEDVAELFAVRAHAKRLELVCGLDPELPGRFVGDPGRVRQILANLIGNALKFTDHGFLQVTARAKVDPSSRVAAVRMTVADTGIGIAADRLPHIFERFYQGDSSITRRFGGSGLGLSISRSLASLMGGTITCESQEGLGSTFTLELPLRLAPSTAAEPAAPLVDQAQALVVQDPGGNRDVLRSWLEQEGFDVTATDSSTTAQAALARAGGAVRLILVSTTLSQSDPIELARALRAATAQTTSPIVAVHPLSLGDQQALTRSGPFDAVVTTPFRRSRFLAVLRAALGLPVPDAPGRSDIGPRVPAPAAGYRVLVAEDNPDNQELARRALEHAGCRVEIVADGRQAASRARAFCFDLILMDLQMPEIDGFTATREIRADEARSGRPPVPIVALTAHALRGFREQCLSAGMNDYLAKPFKAARLRDIVAKWIDRRPVVLVVDDTPEGRTLLRTHLQGTGEYRVLVAANGRDAVAMFETHRVSLILLDMEMPVMDGYAAATAIRRHPDGAHVPIIAVTGHTGEAENARCLRAGCSSVIEKPVTRDALLPAIRSAFDRDAETPDDDTGFGGGGDTSPGEAH